VARKKETITGKGRRRRIWLGVGIFVLLFAAATAWKWTPLADQIDIAKVATWSVSIRNIPARPLIILGAYLIGSLVLIPITVLIIVTALVFGPLLGSIYSFAGCVLGAAVTYTIGYFLGRDFVPQLIGPKWKRVEQKISQTGILAVASLRLLPLAPFTVVNIISGAFKVPLRHYLLGSLLGLAPGIVFINLFAHQIESAIQNPGVGSFTLLGALAAISVLAILWLHRKFGKDSPKKKTST
jgi:phospholipase D1/2